MFYQSSSTVKCFIICHPLHLAGGCADAIVLLFSLFSFHYFSQTTLTHLDACVTGQRSDRISDSWSSAMSLQTFSWTSDEELINESSPQLPIQKPLRLSLLPAKITDVLMNERKRSMIRKIPRSCSFNLMAVFVAITKSWLHAWFVFWCTKEHQHPPASDIKYLPRPFLSARALCHFISPLTTSMFKEALGFSEVWLLVSQGISCFRSSNIRRCLPALFRRKWKWTWIHGGWCEYAATPVMRTEKCLFRKGYIKKKKTTKKTPMIFMTFWFCCYVILFIYLFF